MGQRRALVGKQQHDVADCGLRLAQGKPQTDTINLVRALTALQRVPWPPEAEPPFFAQHLGELRARNAEAFASRDLVGEA